MAKKGDISTAFIIMISFVVIIVIIIIGFKTVSTMRESNVLVEYATFQGEMEKTLEIKKRKFQSLENVDFELPDDVEYVMFMDLDRREDLLHNPVLDKYPLIKDAVRDGVKKNMYIIRRNGENIPYYIGDISVLKIEGQKCTGLGIVSVLDGKFNLVMSGGGGKAIIGEKCKDIYYIVFDSRKDYGMIEQDGRLVTDEDRNIVLLSDTYTGENENYKYYRNNGSFMSPVYTIENFNGFNSIVVDKDVPSGTELKFQIATSAVSNPASWVFSGPTDKDDYYEYSGQMIDAHHAIAGSNPFYMKFKADLKATDNNRTSPSIQRIMVSYFKG